jgi:hypothetical protein
MRTAGTRTIIAVIVGTENGLKTWDNSRNINKMSRKYR